jgi:uncharacterized membrane protein
MSDDPVFVYAAVYADRADADADYDTLLDLHAADLAGSYDVALVYKDDEGKVHVTKHEKPTQHGAWTGAAVGALVGIIFPPSIIGAAVVGAAAGGGIGHALGGMSRSDAKELGEYLDEGEAALVVIGKSRVQERLDKALTRAKKSEEREVEADGKEHKAMDCQIEWNKSKVENDELSASLQPAPDFAFMVEFDGVLDRHNRAGEDRWGKVLLAQGKVVVSDVQPDSAHELRAFLDEAVSEANHLAVDYRTHAREQKDAEAAAAAERQAAQAAAADAAAERDEDLTDEFRA